MRLRYTALAVFTALALSACAAQQPKPVDTSAADQAAARAEAAAQRAEAAAQKAETQADKSEVIFHKGMQK